jgi:chemotaxis protein histidine kinase CheA
MPGDPGDVKAKLAALRQSYVEQLPGKLREIGDAWTRLERGAWDASAFQEFHRAVHALAGSGGMFGLEALSLRARSLDRVLKTLGDGKAPPTPETSRQIADGLAELQEAASS